MPQRSTIGYNGACSTPPPGGESNIIIKITTSIPTEKSKDACQTKKTKAKVKILTHKFEQCAPVSEDNRHKSAEFHRLRNGCP